MAITDTKISHTILEFGRDAFLGLPANHSREEFKLVADAIVTCWNAAAESLFNDNSFFEDQYFLAVEALPDATKNQIRHLFNIRKTLYSKDHRAVGYHEVVEREGDCILRCAAVDVRKKKTN